MFSQGVGVEPSQVTAREYYKKASMASGGKLGPPASGTTALANGRNTARA